MAVTYTQNYNLGKQEDHDDKFDMSIITENMDKIDTALHDKLDKDDFSESDQRAVGTIGTRPEGLYGTLWGHIPNLKSVADTVGIRPETIAVDLWTYMQAFEARLSALEESEG